jgi:hypothetical protein
MRQIHQQPLHLLFHIYIHMYSGMITPKKKGKGKEGQTEERLT